MSKVYHGNSDEDLCKFEEQRLQANLLVGEWKKSELLREASELDCLQLRKELEYVIHHLPREGKIAHKAIQLI